MYVVVPLGKERSVLCRYFKWYLFDEYHFR